MGGEDDGTTSNLGVWAAGEFANEVDTSQGLDSDFGDALYWNNSTIATNVEYYMEA